MNLQHLGTNYGGWTVDVDMIPADGLVIDAGVGTDVSFARALKDLKPGLRFVGIDHTDEAEAWVKHCSIPDYQFIKAAVSARGDKVQMFRHRTRSGSESIFAEHSFADADAPYMVPGVMLRPLVLQLSPCIVKLDIEGAEYEVFMDCFGVPQVCIEFHHRMMNGMTPADTQRVIDQFLARGYKLAHRTPTDEVLLVLA